MALDDLHKITTNRTLMAFICSIIIGIVAAVMWAATGSSFESQQRNQLIMNDQEQDSKLDLIINEILAPDNVTVIRSSDNITLIVPNNSNLTSMGSITSGGNGVDRDSIRIE